MWALIFAALVTKSMEAGSSCVIYSCKKKIVDSNVKIQALKLVSTMKNIATLWTSRKDKKQEKNSKRTGRYLLENYKLSVGRFFAISSEP